MKSIPGLAAVAAAILVAGFAPAVPAAASTAPQWQKTFSAAGYQVYGQATAVSPDGSTVFVTGTAANAVAGADTGAGETIAYNAATGAVIWKAQFNPKPGVDDSGFSSIAVSPNGSTVFVTGHSGDANAGIGLVEAIVAYNAATGAKMWQVIGTTHDSNGVHPLAVSPGSSKVFVTSAGGSATGQDLCLQRRYRHAAVDSVGRRGCHRPVRHGLDAVRHWRADRLGLRADHRGVQRHHRDHDLAGHRERGRTHGRGAQPGRQRAVRLRQW